MTKGKGKEELGSIIRQLSASVNHGLNAVLTPADSRILLQYLIATMQTKQGSKIWGTVIGTINQGIEDIAGELLDQLRKG